jgi:DNA invertase Pin-like site-specific DNA recombinase
MSPEKKPAKPVDIYVRVSQVAGRGGDSFQSPKQQEDRCRSQLKADGLKVGQVFTDLDQSGAKKSRPAFDEAMERIGSGKSGGIIVHDLSRFGRNVRNVLDGIDLIEEHGGVFISCAEKFDTSTSVGRFTLTMFAALRQMEREQTRERWQVSQAEAKKRGVHIGKPRTGYTRTRDGKLVENEHLAVVREVFALRASGGTWGEGVRLFEARAVPTPRGGPWTRQSVQHIVRNEAYREPDGPIPAWQWKKAQANAGGKRAMRGHGYLLGLGLCRCPSCGTGLVRTHSKGEAYLRCPTVGKGHVAIQYAKAEDYIVSLAFSHIGPMLREREGGDGEELRQAVEMARGEVEALEEQIGVTLPAESKQRVALEQAEAALAEWQAQADAPLELSDLLTPLGVRQEVFDKLPMAEKRRVLRQIVKKVVIAPGRGDVGSRLKVEFTDGEVWPAPPMTLQEAEREFEKIKKAYRAEAAA